MLPEQDGAAITEHREVAELVPRLGRRDGLGAWRKHLPRKEPRHIAFKFQGKLLSELLIEQNHTRLSYRSRGGFLEKCLR